MDQGGDLYYNTTNHAMMFRTDVHAKYMVCQFKVGGLGMTIMNRHRWHEILAACERQTQAWEIVAKIDGVFDNYDYPRCNYVERTPEPNETAPASKGQVQGLYDAA